MTDLRRVPDLWRRLDVTVRDLPLGLLLALAALVPALDNRGTQLGDLPGRPMDAMAIVVIALECLPLAVRRRWPAACLALVSLGFAADQLRGYHMVAGTALPIALLSAAAYLERYRRATLVLASLAYVPLAVRLQPDVVVMDVRMPVLDGIEATRLLAGAGVPHPVKVLVVTTFNLDEYVYEALRAGASGFLLKDAPPAQLLHGIRTVATGAALLAPEVTRRLVGRYAARIRPPEGNPGGVALTPRELEVLRLIADGLSNSEIAAALVISQETVKTYVSRILAKLDLRDRVQAVVYAYRRGLVT